MSLGKSIFTESFYNIVFTIEQKSPTLFEDMKFFKYHFGFIQLRKLIKMFNLLIQSSYAKMTNSRRKQIWKLSEEDSKLKFFKKKCVVNRAFVRGV